jgi:hypothetical protein
MGLALVPPHATLASWRRKYEEDQMNDPVADKNPDNRYPNPGENVEPLAVPEQDHRSDDQDAPQ